MTKGHGCPPPYVMNIFFPFFIMYDKMNKICMKGGVRDEPTADRTYHASV